MDNNEFGLRLIAELDGTKSKQRLNQDIEALKKQLGNIEIQAKLGKNVVANLTKQLNATQISLQNVDIDKNAINRMVSQINGALNQININIGGNLNSGGNVQNAQRTGQQIGQQIQNGINSVIQKGGFNKIFKDSGNGLNNVSKDAEKYFQTLSNTVSVQEKLGQNNNLTSFIVSLKNAEGVTEQLNYRLQTLKDNNGNIIERFFEYSGGSINNNGVIKQIDMIESKADSLQRTLDKLKSEYSDPNTTKPIKDSDHISQLEEQYSRVQSAIDGVRNADNSTLSSMVNNTNNEINALEIMGREFQNAETTATQFKNIDISSGIEQASNRFDKLKANSKDIKEMSTTLKDLETSFTDVNDKASLDKFINQLRVGESQLSSIKAEQRQFVSEASRLATSEAWKKWADNNTKALKKYGDQIDNLISKMKNLDDPMTKAEKNNLISQWNQMKNNIRTEGLLGMSSVDKIKNAWEKFGGWSIATGSLMKGVNEIRKAISELKDVDDILTEISKTSNRTKEELKSLGNESYDRASKFGRTAPDWLTGVQEMNRSGFYGEQGNALADTSTLAQSAGDMTAEVANNWILATNAAYKYQAQAEKLNAVLDGTNEITNRNSVNMTDIANAMTTVGSNAANAGVQINELSALIGTAVATTKKEGNEVGTAYKSIFVNLQNTSSSKIQATLEKAGTSMTEIVNGAEQLRSPIAILKDLAKTYNELDQKDPLRSEITRNIGGKHYANILGSTLDGWDQYEKMLKDYSEGSGSAMEEAEKSANNWTGSLNKLSNSWTKLVSNLADSDGITKGIQALASLTDGASSFVKVIDSVSKSVSNLFGILGGEGSSLGGTIGIFTGLIQSLTGHGEIVLRPSL